MPVLRRFDIAIPRAVDPGAIYGVEVLAIGRIRHDFLFPAIVASLVSFEVSKWWGLT